MQTTKSNGHAGPAKAAPIPEPLDTAPTPAPADPFADIKAIVRRLTNQSYAAGFRRATQLIASTVGQLDGESKTKIVHALDLLEEELHKADEAARL